MNEWISVKDKLPEDDREVLVYIPKREGTKQHGRYIAQHKPIPAGDGSNNFWGIRTPGSEWTVYHWSYYAEPIVTHWTELPEPPKEENEDE